MSNIPEQAYQASRERLTFSPIAYTQGAAHAINFLFKSYDYGNTRGFVNSVQRTGGSVTLPLPTNIQDSFQVKVGANELTLLGGIAAEVISGGGKANLEGLAAATGTSGKGEEGPTAGDVISNAQAAAGFFGRNALDALGIGGAAGGISVASGNAINPHVALQFDGVDLKTHTFTWVLAPSSQAESYTIQRAINAFKVAMLPSYGNGGGSAVGRALLDYPDIVEIGFSGLDIAYYYRFKRCMINSFNVNYSPNGVGILAGGRPASVQLELTVTESEIHTKEDYRGNFA